MITFNRIVLAGYLTRDPESGQSQSGVTYCQCGLAVNDPRNEENTLFINICLFNKAAELFAKHMSKRKPVLIEGKLQLKRWKTHEGENKQNYSIAVDGFEFIDSGNRRDRSQQNAFENGGF